MSTVGLAMGGGTSNSSFFPILLGRSLTDIVTASRNTVMAKWETQSSKRIFIHDACPFLLGQVRVIFSA